MDKSLVEKIQNLPQYQQLTQERARLAAVLSVIMLIAYYGFILLVAFAPDFFKTIVIGKTITVGFPMGVGLISLAFILTGIYVYIANTRFEKLTDEIKDEVK